MPDPGGSATINGILYQVLRTADHAAHLHISTDARGRRPLLILEPGDGGDVQVQLGDYLLVEQTKARSGGRSWSLTSVVADVFSDLYAAVRLEDSPRREYRFFTEGHIGQWRAAYTFFQTLPEDVARIDDLDDTEIVQFGGPRASRWTATRRHFVERIVAELREQRGWIEEETLEITTEKTLRLLRDFRFVGGRVQRGLQSRLDERLREFVDDPQQVDAKRRELCFRIVELASEGGREISPGELLKQVGLSGPALSDVQGIHRRMRVRLEAEFRLLGYSVEHDVRPLASAPSESKVLVVTGESGQGKSWALASVAEHASREPGTFAAFVRAASDAEVTMQTANSVLWQEVLGRGLLPSLTTLRRRMLDANPESPFDCAVSVCVDQVLDDRVARELVARALASGQFRLALAVPPSIARALEEQFGESVCVHAVSDFTDSELLAYMERAGIPWAGIPKDVRNVLRRPLLAGMYGDLPRSDNWTPSNEYELFEKYWERIRIAPGGPAHRFAHRVLEEIAFRVLVSGDEYPTDIIELEGVGTNSANDVIEHLERVGWLRVLPDDLVEFGHTRLLNWAASKALARVYVRGSITLEEVEAHVQRTLEMNRVGVFRELGYLLLDVLWCFAAEQKTREAAIQIAETVETWNPEPFYVRSVATLGERAVPILLGRLAGLSGDEDYYRARAIGKALLSVRPTSSINGVAQKLMRSGSALERRVAALILAERPEAEALGQLWTLHQSAHAELRSTESGEGLGLAYLEWELLNDATRSCVALAPDWLTQRILKCVSADEARDLASQLARIDGEQGRSIWNSGKEHLVAVADLSSMSILACFRRFGDRDDATDLEPMLSLENSAVPASAFATIARLHFDRALEILRSEAVSNLISLAQWWLPVLLQQNRQRTLETIRLAHKYELLTAVDVADIFGGHEDDLDGKLLATLLDDIPTRVQNAENGTERDCRVLRVMLSVCSRVSRWPLLHVIRERGPAVEEALIKAALTSRWHADDYATDVLKRIGGRGFDEVVRTALASGSERRQIRMLSRLAHPTPAICEALIELVDGDPERAVMRQEALRLLASAGDRRSVFRAALEHIDGISLSWSALLSGVPEVDDDATGVAVRRVADGGDRARAALVALALSGHEQALETTLGFLVGAREPADIRVGLRVLRTVARPEPRVHEAFVRAYLGGVETDDAAQGLAVLYEQGLEEAFDPIVEHARSEDLGWLTAWRVDAGVATEEELHALWSRTRRQHPLQLRSDAVRVLGHLARIDSDVRTFLIDLAFRAWGEDDTFDAVAHAAVLGLSRFDPTLAFDAAHRVLRSAARDRRWAAGLIVDLDDRRAVDCLAAAITSERNVAVRRAIGRALRRVPSVALHSRVENLQVGKEVNDRRAAIEIAGWTDATWATGLVESEVARARDTETWAIARAAHRRTLARRWVRELAEVFRADVEVRWVVLDAILRVGDPYLLSNEDDPLSLASLLSGAGPAMRRLAAARLNSRRKEDDDEAGRSSTRT